jgi:hypothetical protein
MPPEPVAKPCLVHRTEYWRTSRHVRAGSRSSGRRNHGVSPNEAPERSVTVSTSPISPRRVKRDIPTTDVDKPAARSMFLLQYKPGSVSRSTQIQTLPGGTDGTR